MTVQITSVICRWCSKIQISLVLVVFMIFSSTRCLPQDTRTCHHRVIRKDRTKHEPLWLRNMENVFFYHVHHKIFYGIFVLSVRHRLVRAFEWNSFDFCSLLIRSIFIIPVEFSCIINRINLLSLHLDVVSQMHWVDRLKRRYITVFLQKVSRFPYRILCILKCVSDFKNKMTLSHRHFVSVTRRTRALKVMKWNDTLCVGIPTSTLSMFEKKKT